eukprot:2195956-Rhodomonas_salina.1
MGWGWEERGFGRRPAPRPSASPRKTAAGCRAAVGRDARTRLTTAMWFAQQKRKMAAVNALRTTITTASAAVS